MKDRQISISKLSVHGWFVPFLRFVAVKVFKKSLANVFGDSVFVHKRITVWQFGFTGIVLIQYFLSSNFVSWNQAEEKNYVCPYFW